MAAARRLCALLAGLVAMAAVSLACTSGQGESEQASVVPEVKLDAETSYGNLYSVIYGPYEVEEKERAVQLLLNGDFDNVFADGAAPDQLLGYMGAVHYVLEGTAVAHTGPEVHVIEGLRTYALDLEAGRGPSAEVSSLEVVEEWLESGDARDGEIRRWAEQQLEAGTIDVELASGTVELGKRYQLWVYGWPDEDRWGAQAVFDVDGDTFSAGTFDGDRQMQALYEALYDTNGKYKSNLDAVHQAVREHQEFQRAKPGEFKASKLLEPFVSYAMRARPERAASDVSSAIPGGEVPVEITIILDGSEGDDAEFRIQRSNAGGMAINDDVKRWALPSGDGYVIMMDSAEPGDRVRIQTNRSKGAAADLARLGKDNDLTVGTEGYYAIVDIRGATPTVDSYLDRFDYIAAYDALVIPLSEPNIGPEPTDDVSLTTIPAEDSDDVGPTTSTTEP